MICQTSDCQIDATHRLFWPGKEPLAVCQRHQEWALEVAKAMSFYLHTELIIEPEKEEP